MNCRSVSPRLTRRATGCRGAGQRCLQHHVTLCDWAGRSHAQRRRGAWALCYCASGGGAVVRAAKGLGTRTRSRRNRLAPPRHQRVIWSAAPGVRSHCPARGCCRAGGVLPAAPAVGRQVYIALVRLVGPRLTKCSASRADVFTPLNNGADGSESHCGRAGTGLPAGLTSAARSRWVTATRRVRP